MSTITNDFHKAVDGYLEFCATNGRSPEKTYKGSFNVRIGADLHHKLAMIAFTRGISLNRLVEDAIRQQV